MNPKKCPNFCILNIKTLYLICDLKKAMERLKVHEGKTWIFALFEGTKGKEVKTEGLRILYEFGVHTTWAKVFCEFPRSSLRYTFPPNARLCNRGTRACTWFFRNYYRLAKCYSTFAPKCFTRYALVPLTIWHVARLLFGINALWFRAMDRMFSTHLFLVRDWFLVWIRDPMEIEYWWIVFMAVFVILWKTIVIVRIYISGHVH